MFGSTARGSKEVQIERSWGSGGEDVRGLR